MPTPIIGIVLDWQDPVHGAFELTDITNFSFSDGDSAETMFNVRQEPIGTKRARGPSTIALTQQQTVENAKQPSWRVLKQAGTRCLLTVTAVGADNTTGTRTAYTVTVAKADDSTDSQGEATREIELAVLQENEQ
jgi:hypothetical protein